MVSIEELENKIREERVKAIYDSRDMKELDRKEEESIFWDNYLKKEYHPMSYQIDKEIEEWEQTAPIFKEFQKAEMGILALGFAYLTMWVCISMVVIAYALTS
jgi:butyrate kinase